MSKPVFESFILEHFSNSSKTPIQKIAEEDGLYYSPLLDSYGGSIHTVYLLNYIPPSLHQAVDQYIKSSPTLRKQLQFVHNRYKDQVGQWGMVSPYLQEGQKLNSLLFLTNLQYGNSDHEHREPLNWYSHLCDEIELKADLFYCSFDSMLENKPEELFESITGLLESPAGISINFTQDHSFSINQFSQESSILFCNQQRSSSPIHLEPSIIAKTQQKPEVLAEFQHLINSSPKERELERFIEKYYREIFGNKYDRIETQLWLKFPEEDLFGKGRRLDIFLRNALESDWELIELKVPEKKLLRQYRNIGTLTAEVQNAITQLKVYENMLKRDKVREELKKMGLEYFQPDLRLVIGRKPELSAKQWRFIKKEIARPEISLQNYDDLVNEMKSRLNKSR